MHVVMGYLQMLIFHYDNFKAILLTINLIKSEKYTSRFHPIIYLIKSVEQKGNRWKLLFINEYCIIMNTFHCFLMVFN